jgi:hypothetical protein
MKRSIACAVLLPLASVAIAASAVTPADSAERDRKFFRSIEGAWTGPGEIVAGKYKGTKFTCSFSGTTPSKKLGMTLDGGCRVGLFMQKMSASVERSGSSGYRGKFMDGAAGAGLDIVSGNVIDSGKVVLAINRNQLQGVMQARLPDQNTMAVTVSVRVDETLVPVIGMSLKRVDPTMVGAVEPR